MLIIKRESYMFATHIIYTFLLSIHFVKNESDNYVEKKGERLNTHASQSYHSKRK